MSLAQASVWSSVVAAEGPVTALRRDIAAGRVAHAYLFAGAAGRLPLDVAVAFAAALMCPQGGCRTCEACRRALHRGAHPDIELIEPAGMQLLTEQVREAIRAASRRPVAGDRRVIVVDGADRMNPTAQNAFLKSLEEPPPSTTIILLAPAPEALLETVRSRCREIAFRSPAPTEIAELLVAQGVEAGRARYLARVGGDLERAATLAHDPIAAALRDEVVERAVRRLRDPGEALEAAEWLAGKTGDVKERVAAEHRAAREAFKDWTTETKSMADQRLRREMRRAEQDVLEASIDDIASVLRDLLVLVRDQSADVLNAPLAGPLAERSASLGPGAEPRLISCLARIERARRRLRSNANVLLTLEDVFLALHRAG